LFRHAEAEAHHPLEVVRPLYREEAQQRATQRESQRSHATAIPPPTPATNHPSVAPRPTRRSVPAAPAARAAATAATASSVASRGESGPASSGRTIHARTNPIAVTTAARSAS